jgi:tetratricopeptide (TPR) repeat protein
MTAKRIALTTMALALLGCILLAALLALTTLGSRVAARVDNAAADVRRWWNPPQEVVFQPQQAAQATLNALPPLATQDLASPATPASVPATKAAEAATIPATVAPPVQEMQATAPPPTPPPASARLTGLVHEYQLFNNCGPANLAMALSFWGWQGDQRATRAFLRPNLDVDDKNVNPEEMVAFVQQNTQMQALTRVGGDADLLKRLVSSGFPVIIEAGHDPADDWWMGHYLVVSGYDDAAQAWTVQDSLTNPDLRMTYAELDAWRDFNYVFVLPYPSEREAEVQAILGQRMDAPAAYRLAEARAAQEAAALTGREQFFAWFNLGSSRVGLGDYAGAAQAYDQAFALYARLPEDLRPYRLMWYVDGPYAAYYHTGRYQDVVDLANTTFTWVGKGVLEESFYWRGMAYAALGVTNQAVKDLKRAAELNPNYAAPREALKTLGIDL